MFWVYLLVSATNEGLLGMKYDVLGPFNSDRERKLPATVNGWWLRMSNATTYVGAVTIAKVLSAATAIPFQE